MQKTKNIKHEKHRQRQIVASEKEISYKNGMQFKKKLMGVLMKYMYTQAIAT